MSLTIDVATYHSPSHDARPAMERIRSLVIHTSEGHWPSDAEYLSSATSHVSCHYIIAPDGAIYRLVEEAQRAWHAGVSVFGGLSNWNDFSIGVELSHIRGTPIPPSQKTALSKLSTQLVQKYSISPGFVVTHRQIAVPHGRRSDPTDMDDQDFAAFVASLYSGAGTYRAVIGCPIFEAPRGAARLALAGRAVLLSGNIVEVDSITNEYAHLAASSPTMADTGFVPVGVLERL